MKPAMYTPIAGLEPTKQVLDAFEISNEAKLLPGGLARAFLAGDVVLKFLPDEMEEDVVWLANLLDNIESKNIRVQKFHRSKEGNFLVEGWVAYEYLTGEFRNDIVHLKQKREVLQTFHEAIQNESPPRHVMDRTDPWTSADKMAWGEKPIVCHKRIDNAIKRLVDLVEPIELPYQLIQGDPNHILFSNEKPPAIIDLSWHYRPADFALAVLATDALSCWCNNECACIDSEKVYSTFSDITHFDQLLLRAVIRRVLELEGLRRHDVKYLDTLSGLNPAIEFVYNEISRKRETK